MNYTTITFGLNEDSEGQKTLYVFDFDDTLVDTASSELRVKITHTLKNGRTQTYLLTSDEYAGFKLPTTGKIQLNFGDFESVPDDITIKQNYFNQLKNALTSPNTDSIILTARAADQPVSDFLKMRIKGKQPEVVAVGTSDPIAKSAYISKLIRDNGYTSVIYYDDAIKNVEAVASLVDDFIDVSFDINHVVDE